MTERPAVQASTRTRGARAEAMRTASEALRRMRYGETMVVIFDDLIERGEITMAYRTFAQWMKRFSDDPSLLPDQQEGGRQGSVAKNTQSRDTSAPTKVARKEGDPVHVSMDFMAGAYKPKPPGHKPDMKKLIGPDYEEEF